MVRLKGSELVSFTIYYGAQGVFRHISSFTAWRSRKGMVVLCMQYSLQPGLAIFIFSLWKFFTTCLNIRSGGVSDFSLQFSSSMMQFRYMGMYTIFSSTNQGLDLMHFESCYVMSKISGPSANNEQTLITIPSLKVEHSRREYF